MPYINKEIRERLDSQIDDLIFSLRKEISSGDVRDADGNLNYTITRLLRGVLDLNDDPRYTKFNTAHGILDCVSRELYRKVTAPYEEVKEKENGSVS